MALLPTGSDKLLENNTEEVNIVIKSKKKWQDHKLPDASSVVVEGYGIYSLYLKPDYDKRVYEENKYLKMIGLLNG